MQQYLESLFLIFAVCQVSWYKGIIYNFSIHVLL